MNIQLFNRVHSDTAPETSGLEVWSSALTRPGAGLRRSRLKAELQTGAVTRCAPFNLSVCKMVLLFVVALMLAVQCRAAGGIQTAGDVLQFVMPATAAALTLAYEDKPGAYQLGQSLLLTMGVTEALKYSLNTTRPNGGHRSMPSGHTSISFSSAEFMRKRYGWEYGVPAYATAAFVAYSRVESKQHYTKDVVVGAGIGILSSYIFTKPYKGWTVEADAGHKYYGFRLSRSF